MCRHGLAVSVVAFALLLAVGAVAVPAETPTSGASGAADAKTKAGRGEAVRAEYQKRKAELPAKDADAHFKFAEWCESNDLKAAARRHFASAYRLDPNHDGANKRKGNRLVKTPKGEFWFSKRQYAAFLREKGIFTVPGLPSPKYINRWRRCAPLSVAMKVVAPKKDEIRQASGETVHPRKVLETRFTLRNRTGGVIEREGEKVRSGKTWRGVDRQVIQSTGTRSGLKLRVWSSRFGKTLQFTVTGTYGHRVKLTYRVEVPENKTRVLRSGSANAIRKALDITLFVKGE